MPVTVAEKPKECTAFARSEAGIVGSNPTQGMDVWCVCPFFCVCVVLCLGRGLATSSATFQGVLPTVNDQETEKSTLCSKVVMRQIFSQRTAQYPHFRILSDNWRGYSYFPQLVKQEKG
jgi:hypothetical protein